MEGEKYLFVTLWIVLLLASTSTQQDSRGTEFYVAFLENNPSQTDVQLILVTDSNTPADVTVTTPLYDASFSQTVTVVRGTPQTVTIPSGIKGAGVEKAGKGVYVTSTQEISVTAVNQESESTDAYLVFPADALGTEYYAMTYVQQAELLVMATEDNTNVTITWPDYATASVDVTYDGTTYGPGDTLTVTLSKFEVFHALDSGNNADFTGTHIISTAPVAVVSGNQNVKVPADSTKNTGGHLTEMMPPVYTYGSEFYVKSSPERTGNDTYRVFSPTSNLLVLLPGGPFYLINAGEFVEVVVPSGDQRQWVTTNPVLVAMFEQTWDGDGPKGGDPSMLILPHDAQFDTDYTWSTIQQPDGQDFENRILVTIETDELPRLRLDGQEVSWTEQQNAGDFTHVWAQVSPGVHNLYHTDSTVTFMAAATGTAADNSYSTLAGLRLPNLVSCVSTTMSPGDGVDNDCDQRTDEETYTADDGGAPVGEDLAMPNRVDGAWGEWSTGNCSVSCGNGYQLRTRQCNNPAPQGRGLLCPADDPTVSAEPCNATTCSTGEVCRNNRQRCLTGLTCTQSNWKCLCPSGWSGNGYFECVPPGRRLCFAEGDPHVHSWDAAVAPVTLPCWYGMGQFATFVSQLYASSPALYCSVDVQVLNELTTDSLYYVRAMRVSVQFFTYEGGLPQYTGSPEIFTLTQEDVRSANGDNPWSVNGSVVNDMVLYPSWDAENNFAILDVCNVRVKFRPYVPGSAIPMTFKPGVSVSVPDEAQFLSAPNETVCRSPGEGSSTYKGRASSLNLRNGNQALIHDVLLAADVDQTNGNPDYKTQCVDGGNLLEACDTDRQPMAIQLCSIILNSEFNILSCLVYYEYNPFTIFNHCLDWVCNERGCNDYLDPITNSGCPTTPLMSQIGCSTQNLTAQLP